VKNGQRDNPRHPDVDIEFIDELELNPDSDQDPLSIHDSLGFEPEELGPLRPTEESDHQ